jgi:hypothetical protein
LAAGHRSRASSSEVGLAHVKKTHQDKERAGSDFSEPEFGFDHRPDGDGWNGATKFF